MEFGRGRKFSICEISLSPALLAGPLGQPIPPEILELASLFAAIITLKLGHFRNLAMHSGARPIVNKHCSWPFLSVIFDCEREKWLM